MASAPPGRSARADFSTRTASSIQWNDVAATTKSNAPSGTGTSSNGPTTTRTSGYFESTLPTSAARGQRGAQLYSRDSRSRRGDRDGQLTSSAADLQNPATDTQVRQPDQVRHHLWRIARTSSVIALCDVVERLPETPQYRVHCVHPTTNGPRGACLISLSCCRHASCRSRRNSLPLVRDGILGRVGTAATGGTIAQLLGHAMLTAMGLG